ncbi:MAG: HAMP domain-containing histidine kinase [Armatimonadetes bacterium]|nr:HAMP domain-containing histidine kinase [Armatimonadota bacterium]MCX7966895.1 HAMP domain-containing histidine kinase [Armatimonadota bacterium]MDW8141853.1 HAMP domain-containing sensor histidine kinase [Armatimonadota bacterium]
MAKREKSENQTEQAWSSVLPQLLRAGQGETILNLLPSAIHELNNALNTVLGFADLLQSETSISKTLKEDLKTIERAGIRARELLGILRILANGVSNQVQIMPVDLPELCEQVCSLMAAAFRRNYVRLVTDYSAQTPVILSDASRLRFVLLALLQNANDAVGASGEGGQILIRTGQDEEGRAVVVIEDEGCGLPEEVSSKLFKPFVTTKPKGKGAGFGLFIAHQFVTELQGKIEIQKTDRGTKVILVLPSLQIQT